MRRIILVSQSISPLSKLDFAVWKTYRDSSVEGRCEDGGIREPVSAVGTEHDARERISCKRKDVSDNKEMFARVWGRTEDEF